jgi:putative ABC transport system ATP-binding protein
VVTPQPNMVPEQMGPIAARAVDAVKIYGQQATEVRALNGLSVDFAAGRFTAIMGPSGSGKSTLLQCLAGLDRLTSGHAYIANTELGPLSEKEITAVRREQIGFVFQTFNLVPTLDARENITLPLALAKREPDAAWLEHLIEIVGLKDRLHHRPHELSGGEQQRVAAARALAGKPQIVFADEPTGNLDSRKSAELLNFMRRAVDELNQTIVMVTHDPAAASYSDRVVFLADGQIVGEMAQPSVELVLEKLKDLEA